MTKIYSIGYSPYRIDKFIEKLKDYQISWLIDVRSNPHSSFFPHYNKKRLEKTLGDFNILYRSFSTEFGARQRDPRYHSPQGWVDFGKFIRSKAFGQGVKQVLEGVEKGHTPVLMCAEKDPLNCHRSIMVGRGFRSFNLNICHLLADGSIESQKDIEERLLDLYFKDRGQISLFGDENHPDSLILRAYIKRNEEMEGKRT